MSEQLTPDEVKAKVRAVLVLMRPEWRFAAMDATCEWCCYDSEPEIENEWSDWTCETFVASLAPFPLPPFPGNWQDSLVEREAPNA